MIVTIKVGTNTFQLDSHSNLPAHWHVALGYLFEQVLQHQLCYLSNPYAHHCVAGHLKSFKNQ